MTIRGPKEWRSIYAFGQVVRLQTPLDELETMLTEPPPRCWLAMLVLGRRGDEASLAMLVEQADDQDAYRRRAAVEAIGQHRLGAQAVETVRQLERDAVGHVVRSAVGAAAALRDAGSHDRAVELLCDPVPVTRIAAVEAVGSLWQPEDLDRVMNVALRDPDQDTRRWAGFTLRNNVDRENWRRLVDLWLTGPLPRERAWACQVIGQFGTLEDSARLAPLLVDPNGHVRKAALRAIDSLGSHVG